LPFGLTIRDDTQLDSAILQFLQRGVRIFKWHAMLRVARPKMRKQTVSKRRAQIPFRCQSGIELRLVTVAVVVEGNDALDERRLADDLQVVLKNPKLLFNEILDEQIAIVQCAIKVEINSLYHFFTVRDVSESAVECCQFLTGGKSMKPHLAIVVASAMMAMAVSLLQAHHAFASEFDESKPLTVTGKMVRFEWVNPHSTITLEVTNPDGTKTLWQGQAGSTNQIIKSGWLRGVAEGFIQSGETVTIKGYAAKTGGTLMFATDMTRSDGKTVMALSGPIGSEHHSYSETYDNGKSVTLIGKTIDFEWAKPRSKISIEVTNPDGSKAIWKGVVPGGTVLTKSGWTKQWTQDMVAKGEVVTITGWLARDGSTQLLSQILKRANGLTISG